MREALPGASVTRFGADHDLSNLRRALDTQNIHLMREPSADHHGLAVDSFALLSITNQAFRVSRPQSRLPV
jgi:hypothetical protein